MIDTVVLCHERLKYNRDEISMSLIEKYLMSIGGRGGGAKTGVVVCGTPYHGVVAGPCRDGLVDGDTGGSKLVVGAQKGLVVHASWLVTHRQDSHSDTCTVTPA